MAKQHAYLKKLRALTLRTPVFVGEVREVIVSHEATCGIFQGGTCRCDAEVYFADPPETDRSHPYDRSSADPPC